MSEITMAGQTLRDNTSQDILFSLVRMSRRKRRMKQKSYNMKRARTFSEAANRSASLQLHMQTQNEFITLVNAFAQKTDKQAKRRIKLTPSPSHPIVPKERYSFRSSPSDPRSLFRFTEEEIRTIARTMNVPLWHTTASRDRFTIIEGLCILCRRLVFPARWTDLVSLFGRSKGPLSRIYGYMLNFILAKYSHLLEFRAERIRCKLREWAAAVARVCPNSYDNIFGFLDGTMRRTCRPRPDSTKIPVGVTPDMIQRAQYDGRKKRHGFKYHALIVPAGLIVHAYGPVDGRRHDVIVARRSGLLDELTNVYVDEVPYAIYADSAYGISLHVQTPFRKALAGTPEAQLNTCMARARTVASECTYGIVTNQWQAVDYVRWQRMFRTHPAKQYMCAILLTNMQLCIRRTNQVAHFFGCANQAPTLANYLQGQWYP